MASEEQELRDLPRVDVLASKLTGDTLSTAEATSLARTAIDLARSKILDGEAPDVEAMASDLVSGVLASRSRRMINATGVILHTNLGRAPLSTAALGAMQEAAGSYTNAEFDLVARTRGKRGEHTRHLLKTLTGAEDALVVNNNAAALLLALSALANGRHVPVSRGELVEIGGSYRLPDVMRASGAQMAEVGTTNKTRPGDYAVALQTHDCGMLLKVHRANYQITGFVETVDPSDLVGLAGQFNVPFVYDIGSGLLDSTTPWLTDRPGWAEHEPGVRQIIDTGADLVMFSGDKLLGGPQAGILVGKSRIIGELRSNPLRRAMRIDSATDAALAATLAAYAHRRVEEIPFWRMVTQSEEQLADRVRPIATELNGFVEIGHSVIGAGSAPSAQLVTPLIRIPDKEKLFDALLTAETPILARRDRGDLLVDLRTVEPRDDLYLTKAIGKCL